MQRQPLGPTMANLQEPLGHRPIINMLSLPTITLLSLLTITLFKIPTMSQLHSQFTMSM